jgi:hypothetical protein
MRQILFFRSHSGWDWMAFRPPQLTWAKPQNCQFVRCFCMSSTLNWFNDPAFFEALVDLLINTYIDAQDEIL